MFPSINSTSVVYGVNVALDIKRHSIIAILAQHQFPGNGSYVDYQYELSDGNSGADDICQRLRLEYMLGYGYKVIMNNTLDLKPFVLFGQVQDDWHLTIKNVTIDSDDSSVPSSSWAGRLGIETRFFPYSRFSPYAIVGYTLAPSLLTGDLDTIFASGQRGTGKPADDGSFSKQDVSSIDVRLGVSVNF